MYGGLEEERKERGSREDNLEEDKKQKKEMMNCLVI